MDREPAARTDWRFWGSYPTSGWVAADPAMARIKEIVSAEGWYAVFARASGTTREHASAGGPRPGAMSRAGGPVPEFLPLVAWALVVDDTDSEPERVVGIIVHEDQQPEAVLSDDPSFLGYAGPGD